MNDKGNNRMKITWLQKWVYFCVYNGVVIKRWNVEEIKVCGIKRKHGTAVRLCVPDGV